MVAGAAVGQVEDQQGYARPLLMYQWIHEGGEVCALHLQAIEEAKADAAAKAS
jgi:hypothetical protein